MQRTFSSGRVTIVDLENKFRVTHFLFKNYNSQAALPFTDVIASQMKLLLYQGHVVKSLPKWLRLHIYMEVELQWAMELDSTLELDIIHQTMCNMQVVPDKKHLKEISGFGLLRPFWTNLERQCGQWPKENFFFKGGVPLANGCWKAEMINCLCARCTFILPWYYRHATSPNFAAAFASFSEFSQDSVAFREFLKVQANPLFYEEEQLYIIQ